MTLDLRGAQPVREGAPAGHASMNGADAVVRLAGEKVDAGRWGRRAPASQDETRNRSGGG